MPTKPLTLQQRSAATAGTDHAQQRRTSCQRGYGYAWQKYRRAFLMMPEHAVCAECQREPASHVDHRTPVSGADDPNFWNPENHQGLCPGCHARKTARDDGGFGNAKTRNSAAC